MNKKELKEYQDNLIQGAKGTMKLGIVTGVGSSVVGSIRAGVPGSAPAQGAIHSALGLAAVGNLAVVGLNILPKQKKSLKTNKNAVDDPLSFF